LSFGQRALEFFREHIAFIAVLIIIAGFFLITAGLLIDTNYNYPLTAQVFIKTGIAVFGAGVFSVFFKALQASGVFREELAKIVFFDSVHLNSRGDIEDIWRNTTRALHRNAFPDIDEKITEAVRDVYLPVNRDYCYQTAIRDHRLEWLDAQRPNLVRVVLKIKAELVPRRNVGKVNFRIVYRARRIEGVDNQFQTTNLKVDGKEIKLSAVRTAADNPDQVNLKFEVSLKASECVPISMEQTYIVDVYTEHDYFQAISYVDGLDVFVRYPADSMRVIFNGVGAEFDDIVEERPGLLSKRAKTLLFAQQGYVMSLCRI